MAAMQSSQALMANLTEASTVEAELRANGGKLLVIDPRRSATAEWASTHLRPRPGSDTALANGILHVLIAEQLIDMAYIANRTEGFDEVRQLAATTGAGSPA